MPQISVASLRHCWRKYVGRHLADTSPRTQISKDYYVVGVIQNQGIPLSGSFSTFNPLVYADNTINAAGGAQAGEELVSEVVADQFLAEIIDH